MLNAAFHEVIALEDELPGHVLHAERGTGLDVISVLLYRLPGPLLVDTRAQQVARIRAGNRTLNITVKHPLEDTVVGGLPAFDESVVQPGGCRYGTWFIFGGEHLLQINCQIDTHAAAWPPAASPPSSRSSSADPRTVLSENRQPLSVVAGRLGA